MTASREVAAPPNSPLRGWGGACAIFTAVVLVALAATIGIAWQWGGQRYLLSAAVAWGLVWVAALIALVIVFLGRQLGQGLGAVLIGMGVRMGLPLMAAIMLTQQSPLWSETKLMPFLLGNYFLALIAETSLAVQLLAGTNPMQKSSSSGSPSHSSSKLAPKA